MAPPEDARSTAPVEGKPRRFNPFSPEFRRDPYAQYRDLRANDPHHKTMGMWVLTRYADVHKVLTDRRFSSSQIPDLISRQGQNLGQRHFDAIEQLGKKSIVFTDRPDHTRLRHLVNKVFNLAAVEALKPRIAATAERLIDAIAGQGHLDVIADFADPLPLHVMSDMMELPQELRPAVKGWTHKIRFLLEPALMSRRDFEEVHAVLHEYMACIRGQVEQRRKRPGEDLISQLLAIRIGDDQLSEEEVIFTCIMTFVAGHETTKSLIGNGMLALLQNPDQLQRLLQRPELLGSAVEEMLRYDSPLQQTKRRATEDVPLGERTLRAGDQVLLCLGAANRDPDRFPDPDRFDIARADNAHLAFGAGIHGCLGAALAGAEARVAFDVLLRRLRGLTLSAEPPEWSPHSLILRSLVRLPVSFQA